LIPDPDKFIALFTEEYKSFQAVIPTGLGLPDTDP